MQDEIIEGFRLSPQQRHFWGLQNSDHGLPALAGCTISIEGPLNRELLRASLEQTVRQHEALRLRFHCLPGMTIPLQVINGEGMVWHSATELKDIEPRRAAKDNQIHLAEALPIFDLNGRESLHARLVTLSPTSHRLFIHVPVLQCDARGLENLTREIGKNYQALIHGIQATYSSLQYSVASEWLNDLLESEDAEAGRNYWQEQALRTRLDVELPFEQRPYQPARFAPQYFAEQLDKETLTSLKSLANKFNSSIDSLLLTCFHLLLWRLTGEADITVGMAYDGRTDQELADALGLFAKYLPINCRLQGKMKFGELLEQVNAARSDAQDWQECFAWDKFLPKETLGGPERFFPFCFALEESPAKHYATDVIFSIYKQAAWVDRFKIKVSYVQGEDSAAIQLHYDPAVYESDDVVRLNAQFHTLVHSLLNDTEADIGRLKLLDDVEREWMLRRFNNTRTDFCVTSLIHKLFEEQVQRAPEHTALIFEGLSMSYRELNERANMLAHHLQGLGVGPDSLVGICVERSPEMLVGLLGILKAGGAYVPIDPASPPARRAFILGDIDAPVLLTQSQLLAETGDSGAHVICLDSDWNQIGLQSRANPASRATKDNLAYVIYTSGSTGQPKGVMISHRAICNRLLWAQHAFPPVPNEVLLQKTVFTFDASVWELFVPLMAGASLVLARPGGQQDSAYLVDTVIKHEITTLQLVPSMLRVFLEEERVAECRSLRRVFCGGEALPTELQVKFESLLKAELINLYGPTETAIDATFWKCEAVSSRRLVPIGKPLANMQLYSLDQNFEPSPPGVMGELYISGVGLARGYINQPELTAEKFIPDPFGIEGGSRLYRTGDLGRTLPNGSVEFLGRADHQVKLRGYRIELSEIEAVLSQHPQVETCVVQMREDVPGDQRLVAYLVPSRAKSDDSSKHQLYKLPNGVEIAHLNRNETDHLYEEIFDQRYYLRHDISIKDGDCILDVGANIGMFTLFVNDLCRQATIYAFEPVPKTFEALRFNINLYDLNVTPYNCGLSDHNGTATFTFYPEVSASSGMYADAQADEQVMRAYLANQDERLSDFADQLMEGRFNAETFECPLKTISEVIRENQIARIDLLKLDVEKSELDVLRGIRPSDWPKVKQIVAEVHDVDGHLEEITKLLNSQGFQVTLEQDIRFESTGLFNLYAKRSSETEEALDQPARNGRHAHSYLIQQTLSVSGLQAYLNEKLPEYMIPAAFVRLEELPTLPNGKVDRHALPAPDSARPELADSYVAPRNAIEAQLAAAWTELLGITRVGINDNFFELGGHSLLATQAISSIQEYFNVELSLRSFFESPTIAGVAVNIVQRLAEPVADEELAKILAELEAPVAADAAPIIPTRASKTATQS